MHEYLSGRGVCPRSLWIPFEKIRALVGTFLRNYYSKNDGHSSESLHRDRLSFSEVSSVTERTEIIAHKAEAGREFFLHCIHGWKVLYSKHNSLTGRATTKNMPACQGTRYLSRALRRAPALGGEKGMDGLRLLDPSTAYCRQLYETEMK